MAESSVAESEPVAMVPGRSIQAIDTNSVRQICSGQGIPNLATGVKELVENALDAGATKVEVKLKNYGLDSFEVSDNGEGIKASDFETVCRKHCTSKIAQFDDIAGVTSYGFRGEALSSLCELSASVVVITRVESEDVGTRLEYNPDGSVKSQKMVARAVGTTVLVEGLFAPLAVRRKEYKRNIKTQYSKLLSVLQAYALVSTGVRLSCVNFASSRRDAVLATQGSKALKNNIISVFGNKFFTELIPFSCNIPLGSVPDSSVTDDGSSVSPIDTDENDDDGREKGSKGKENANESNSPQLVVTGFVSKAGAGIGRNNSDRQFLFLNRRPVDMTKATRAINEAWRQFEMKHKPGFVICLEMQSGLFDINMTPDKRQVLLTHEQQAISLLKEHLLKLWEPSRNVFQATRLDDLIAMTPNTKNSTSANAVGNGTNLQTIGGTKRTVGAQVDDDDDDDEFEPKLPQGVTQNRPKEPRSKRRREIGQEQGDTEAAFEIEAAEPMDVVSPLRVTPSLSRPSTSPAYVSSESHLHRGNSNNSPQESQFMSQKHRLAEQLPKSMLDDLSPNDDDDTGLGQREDGRGDAGTDADGSASQGALSFSSALSGMPHMQQSGSMNPRRHQQRESMFQQSPAMSRTPATVRLEGNNNNNNNNNNSNNNNSNNTNDEDDGDGEGGGGVSGDVGGASVPLTERKPKHLRKCVDVGSVDALEQKLNERLHRANLVRKRKAVMRQTTQQNKDAAMASVEGKANDEEEEEALAKGHWKNCGADGEDNVTATSELERLFNKRDFGIAQILGQFNLGFIVVRVRDDLFILDQHASDEKFRFEMLQRTTKIHEQRLIRPLPIELSAAEEQTVLEHMDVFESNGFKFDTGRDEPVDSTLDSTAEAATDDVVEGDGGDVAVSVVRKLKLLTIPHTFKTQFGATDVHDLASTLRDAPPPPAFMRSKDYKHPRIPRMRAMFASRACRSAVMIGSTLSREKLTTVVRNLTDLEQPWNCPHGRPTMRHLVDLRELVQHRDGDEDQIASYWGGLAH